jgi:hypothetical protein
LLIAFLERDQHLIEQAAQALVIGDHLRAQTPGLA